METETCVAVVKNHFGIAKDGQFIAIDTRTGQPFKLNEGAVSSDKRSKPFQSFVWSHTPHHLGIVYCNYNFVKRHQFNGSNEMYFTSFIVYDRPYMISSSSNGVEIRMLNDFGSSTNDFGSSTKEGLAIKHLTWLKRGVLIAASDSNLYYIEKSIDYSCYNCGKRNDHLSRDCTEIVQQYTRCPKCGVVATSKTSHKISCDNTSFRSQKIGEYELPFMEMHKIRFTFKNAETIYCAQETVNGNEDFLITKFFTVDSNVKFQRIFDGTNDITLDVEFKQLIFNCTVK